MNMPKLNYFEYDYQRYYNLLQQNDATEVIQLGEMLTSIANTVKCPVDKYESATHLFLFKDGFINPTYIDDKYKDVKEKYLIKMDVFNTDLYCLNLKELGIEIWEIFRTRDNYCDYLELNVLEQNEIHEFAFDERQFIRTSKQLICVLIDIYLHYEYGKSYYSDLSDIIE